MRVFFYCTNPKIKDIGTLHKYGGSGTLSSVLYVARGLAEMGHDVTICGPQESEAKDSQINFENTKDDFEFVKFSKNRNPDIIVVVGHASEILSCSRLPARKVFYWAHNWINIKARVRDCRKGRLDKIIYVSRYHFIKSVFRRIFDFTSIKYMTWVHNPMYLDLYTNVRNSKKSNSLNISFLSFPSKAKGLPEVISIFNRIYQYDNSAKLHIFGSSELYNSSLTGYGECHDLLIDDNNEVRPGIVLHGTVGKTELISILQDSDLAISGLTGTETFCLALSEAMACGVPALSLNKGGQIDFIVDGFNGFLCRNTVDAELKILNYLSLTEDEKNKIKANARKTVERFDYKKICKEWDLFFNSRDKSIFKKFFLF